MAFQEKVIQQSHWSMEAQDALNIALDGCEELYKNEVNKGISQLYKIGKNSWCILRVETDNKTKDLILVGCCYQGENYLGFADYIIAKAKTLKIKYIRVHSKRAGIGRWLVKKLKFVVSEIRDTETVYLLKV
ncbi:MAG: hypothetical protein QM500_04140 [Methylococcales bacterium]